MKKLIVILLPIVFLISCKGNSDADYVSGFRELRAFGKYYANEVKDSIMKESYKLDSIRKVKSPKPWHKYY